MRATHRRGILPRMDLQEISTVDPAYRKATDQPETSRVLVAFAYGKGMVLACEPGVVLDYIRENGGDADEDGFSLDYEGVDYAPQEPGVYVGVLKVLPAGPGDWPGTQEYMPGLDDVRPATAEEWEAHLRGEWPWEPRSKA